MNWQSALVCHGGAAARGVRVRVEEEEREGGGHRPLVFSSGRARCCGTCREGSLRPLAGSGPALHTLNAQPLHRTVVSTVPELCSWLTCSCCCCSLSFFLRVSVPNQSPPPPSSQARDDNDCRGAQRSWHVARAGGLHDRQAQAMRSCWGGCVELS